MFIAVCESESINDCTQITWKDFKELHSENFWDVSMLEPTDLATAFAAGFTTLGAILIIVKSVSVVLSLMK